MLRSPFRFETALTSLTLIAACSGGGAPSDGPDSGGTAGSSVSGSSGNSTAGTGMPTGGTGSSGIGGNTAGSSGRGTAGTTAGTSPTAGVSGTGPGGSASSGTGGTPPAAGGTTAGLGGSSVGGGGSSSGGTPPTAGTGPDLDANGKPNAPPGTTTSMAEDYLRLGEIRILNNNWGSAALGCNAPMSVFIDQDSTFGWNFNRGDCDVQNTAGNPDFPQIEFGIHPFGIGDDRVTSPEFSSTTLLPIQLKDVQSATVNIQNLTATFQQETSWNITFEFWVSQRNPVTDPDPGVYAELMTFWGWQNGRWPSPPNGTGPLGNGAGNQVQSGGKTYTLWVQDDAWADGQWRYFQFRADDGPQKNFSGTLDVKPFIDYLVNSRQYSPDFWISRLEVGSEIDDNTQGTVRMSGITFEINGQTRPAIIGSN